MAADNKDNPGKTKETQAGLNQDRQARKTNKNGLEKMDLEADPGIQAAGQSAINQKTGSDSEPQRSTDDALPSISRQELDQLKQKVQQRVMGPPAAADKSADQTGKDGPDSARDDAPDSQLDPMVEQLVKALKPHLSGVKDGDIASVISQVSGDLVKTLKAETGTSRAKERAADVPAPWQKGQPSAPPRLSTVESTLESRLGSNLHPEYHEMPWHQRTRMFSFEWDQLRRRRLGALKTYFDSFQPRWERPDWKHFNLARRQADSRGAHYLDWISAQYDRLSKPDNGQVPPERLHGMEAVQAFIKKQKDSLPQITRIGGISEAEQAPSRPEQAEPQTQSTAVQNTDRRADPVERYAALLNELERMAATVYGEDKFGFARLALQAVNSGQLTMDALEKRPSLKVQVYTLMNEERRNESTAKNRIAKALNTKPPIII